MKSKTESEIVIVNKIDRSIEIVIDDKTTKYASKSDAIRKLDKAGMKRTEIAKIMNCRYQMIRNILENEKNQAILATLKDATK